MIAFDTAADFTSVNPGTSVTYSHTCSGKERILFVLTRGGGGEGDKITGVTYAGVALTRVDSQANPTFAEVTSLWYLLNPTLGSNSIVVSLSSGFMEVCSASYTGVRQTPPLDASTKNSTTASSIATPITTIANNAWLVAAVRASGNTISAGSGAYDRITAGSGSASIFDSNGVKTPPGSHSMEATTPDSRAWAVVMASIAPALQNGSPLFFGGGLTIG